MDPEQSSQQHQHPYLYGRRERIFYTLAGMLLTVVGALLIMRSRFVQTFVPPEPTDPTASPSITVVRPSQLYTYFHHHLPTIITIVTATLSTLFPALFLTGQWLHAVQHRLENVFVKTMVRIFSFMLSTLAFYAATRVGTKIFMYHNLPDPHNLKALTHDATKILDLQYESPEEIKGLLLLDPWTIGTVAIFSLSSLCLARLMPNPESYYHMHEVSLDLTCHLAGDYFGANIFYAGIVFLSCVIVIIVKELTEPRQHDPPAPPAVTSDDHPPQVPPPAHEGMTSLRSEIYGRRGRRKEQPAGSSTVRSWATTPYGPVEDSGHTPREGGICANASHVDEDEVTSPLKGI